MGKSKTFSDVRVEAVFINIASPVLQLAMVSLFLLCIFVPAGIAAHRSDTDMLDALSKMFEGVPTHDQELCEKVVYSSLYDKWLQSYLRGDTKTSSALWAQIVHGLNSCNSIGFLIYRAAYQVRFHAPDNATDKSRFGLIPFYRNLLQFTETAVGRDHRFLPEILAILAHHYETHGNYASALECHHRAQMILRATRGTEHKGIALQMFGEAYDDYILRDYNKAEALVQQVIDRADRIHSPELLKASVRLYIKVLMVTDRKQECQALLRKYGST